MISAYHCRERNDDTLVDLTTYSILIHIHEPTKYEDHVTTVSRTTRLWTALNGTGQVKDMERIKLHARRCQRVYDATKARNISKA
jgi:hypothetical protein